MNIAFKYCYFLLLIFLILQKTSFPQLSKIDSLKHAFETETTDSSKVFFLCSKSSLFKDTNYDSTLFYAQTALKIAEGSPDSSLVLKACLEIMNTAMEYRRYRKHDEAEELMIICLQHRKKAGNEYLLIASYNNLMINYINCKEYDKAIEVGKMARELSFKFIKSQDSIIKINALNGLGTNFYYFGQIHFEKGDYDLAIENYTQSVYYRNITGIPRAKAQSLSGLASIFVKQHKYQEAIKYYNASLLIYKENKKLTGIIKMTRSLGTVYELQQDFSNALSYYYKALSLQLKYPPDFELHISYLMVGSLYNQISRLPKDKTSQIFPDMKSYSEEKFTKVLTDSASIYLTKAYNLSKQIDDKLTLVKSLKVLADISSKEKNYVKAISQLNEVIDIARKLGAKVELYEAYYSLSMVLEECGQIRETLKYYKLYSTLKDSVFNEKSSQQIAEIQIKFESEKKDQEIQLLNMDKEISHEQLARQKVQRNGIIIILAFLVLIGILLFKSLHFRKKLEKQVAIINERNRISADLHDDIGTGLSKISLLSEIVRNHAKKPETKIEVQKIAKTAKELLQSISEIIWALNSNNDYIDNMIAYTRRYAAEYFEYLPLKLKIVTPAEISHTHISGDCRRNIFYIIKEAMHNIVKHANATEVILQFLVENNVLSVIIRDNGKGITNRELNRFGNGLNNMENRMKNINGKLFISNHSGTEITLILPIKEAKI